MRIGLALALAVIPAVADASPQRSAEFGVGGGYGIAAAFQDCGTGRVGGGADLWMAMPTAALPWLAVRAGFGGATFSDGELDSGALTEQRGGHLYAASVGTEARVRIHLVSLAIAGSAVAGRACPNACGCDGGFGGQLTVRSGLQLAESWQVGTYFQVTLFDTDPDLGLWAIVGIHVIHTL